MEPVTHLLTGACLSRSGLNRRAAYATATMVVAAELPDIDTLWGLRGPLEGFQHHRGISHTFLGVPVEAAVLVLGVYLFHRWRERRRRHRPSAQQGTPARIDRPTAPAPPRWAMLYALALLALLSHLLLDYTNNYGVRPFFPFNSRWYAGSIVFIVDPWILLMLAAGLLAPVLFGLINTEVGARGERFRGRGWARAALIGLVLYWGLRTVEHARAVQLATAQTLTVTPPAAAPDISQDIAGGDPSAPLPTVTPVYLSAQRVLASPTPFNVLRWSTVTDFGPVYQLAEVDTHLGLWTPGQTTYPKPALTPAVRAAEASRLGRVYLDWSSMPILTVSPAGSGSAGGYGTAVDPATREPLPTGETLVTLRDPRFMAPIPLLDSQGRSALTGTVTLDAADRVLEQTLDGRVEP